MFSQYFASACFGLTKKLRFNSVMLEGEERTVIKVCFAKLEIVVGLRNGTEVKRKYCICAPHGDNGTFSYG